MPQHTRKGRDRVKKIIARRSLLLQIIINCGPLSPSTFNANSNRRIISLLSIDHIMPLLVIINVNVTRASAVPVPATTLYRQRSRDWSEPTPTATD